MRLKELFEAKLSVGIIFGRFNPPHKGHRAAWEMASKNPQWFVGTNQSTVGPKDPLPYDVKIEAMKAIWPELEGHIVAEQSWWTLAAMVYKQFGDVPLNLYTDEDALAQQVIGYNGREGPHGFYNFTDIQQVATPRLSSATELRDAVKAQDKAAFGKAAGVDPDTKVSGYSFFDLVSHYLMPYKHAEDEKIKAKAERDRLKAEKELAKANKAKSKSLEESTSLSTTIRAIVNDIGEPITNVYDTMKYQAKKYVDNYGELGRGFGLVAAGVGGRWVQSVYTNKLQNELYDLIKYNTRRTVDLQKFLRGVETGGELEMKRSFSSIANELPEILVKLGQYLDAPQLTKNAQRWIQNKAAYEQYIANLEADDSDDDYQEPVTKAPKSTAVGQQNAQVDQIVNSIISKLPNKIQGDIRNAIARSSNKLQALQTELQKRGVSVPISEAKEKASKATADYHEHAKGKNKCKDCTMYRAPNKCTAVEGYISPQGVCKWFKSMPNKDKDTK